MRSLDGIHGAVAPDSPWRQDGTAIVEAFPTADGATSESRDTLDRVREAAHGAGPDVRVGGNLALNDDFIEAVYGNFPLMIALIGIITFILLARAFRSLLLPAKAVVLNVLSIAAAWGVLVVVWQLGWGSEAIWGIASTGSVPSWIPLMIFAFLFGLSMDYEVFILARMREEYDATGSTRRGGRARHRPHRAAGHERGADPVPRVHVAGVEPGDGREDAGHRVGGRDPVRRDRDPGPAGAGGGVAVRPLELVAAGAAGAAAAREAVDPASGWRGRPRAARN